MGVDSKTFELARLYKDWSNHDENTDKWPLGRYRKLAMRFVEFGQYPVARVVAEAGLNLQPNAANHFRDRDYHLRHLLALAHVRSGNLAQARAVAIPLLEELQCRSNKELGPRAKFLREETLNLLGRSYKDEAYLESDPLKAKHLINQAYGYYWKSFQTTGRYWSGIVAATLAKLDGRDREANETARKVQSLCQRLKAKREKKDKTLSSGYTYWELATLGEAALILSEFDEAERNYVEAAQLAPNDFGSLISTRCHAKRLLANADRDVALIDDWLPIPKVAVFSGHLLDRPDRKEERFPERMAERVKETIKDWMIRLRVKIGFSSLAVGSDILFQEALLELDGEAHIFLPYKEEAFIENCVAIGSEEDNRRWIDRFKAITDRATRIVHASPSPLHVRDMSYHYANLMLLGAATSRSEELETQLLALAVWNGKRGDGFGGTATTVAWWQTQSIPVHQVELAASCSSNHSEILVRESISLTNEQMEAGAIPSKIADCTISGLLFADAVGFSKLQDEQIAPFLDVYLTAVADLVRTWQSSITVTETWGDGLFVAFDSLKAAGMFALELTRRIDAFDWRSSGFAEDISVRIALHAGPVQRGTNAVTGQANCSGCHISHAARLEPKTQPGQVYASEAFAALAKLESITKFRCQYVKQLEYAKHYGSFPTYVVQEN